MNVNDSKSTQMTQSEIGVHPVDWSIRRVDSLFDIQQGKSVSKAHRIGDNQKPFLRTKNIFWGHIDLTELDQMHFTVTEEDRLKLQTGDLLLCEGGDVGRTAVWNDQAKGCYYQNHLHRLRAKVASEVDPQFALYWFWYAFEIADIYIGRSNITTIPNLSQSKLSELQIPKPEFDEQRRIAYILNILQTAIEQQVRQIALMRELKSALMHKLFTEGLHGEKQKETEIGLVPESWEVVKLGSIADLRKEMINPNSSSNEIYIGLEHIESARFWWSCNGHPSEVRSAKNTFYPGDILYGKLRPYLDKAVIASSTGICSTDILVFTPKDGITSNFLVIVLHTSNLLAYAIKTTSGVNHPRTSWNSLQEYRFGLPQEDERNELTQIMTILETKILYAEKKRIIFEELFRTLLQQLMTGQMRVNEIDLPGLWQGENGV